MKLGDRIKTKRGYDGVFLVQLFNGKCAVILDGCTYHDEHWYDLVPYEDIYPIESSKCKDPADPVLKPKFISCTACGLVYDAGLPILHVCPEFRGGWGTYPRIPPNYPNYPVYC